MEDYLRARDFRGRQVKISYHAIKWLEKEWDSLSDEFSAFRHQANREANKDANSDLLDRIGHILWICGRSLLPYSREMRLGRMLSVEVEAYFKPANGKENRVCQKVAARLFGGQHWRQDGTDTIVTRFMYSKFDDKQAVEAFKQCLEKMRNKEWISSWIGPLATAIFIGVCRRTFGPAVAKKMRTHYNRHHKEILALKAKTEAKQARAAETIAELAKSPVFDNEGKFRLESSRN